MDYLLQVSGKKETIYLDQIQAEKLMLSLLKGIKSQFILIGDEMVNTSFIVSLTQEKLDRWQYSDSEEKEKKLTAEENRTHQKYLKMKETLLKEMEITPQISA